MGRRTVAGATRRSPSSGPTKLQFRGHNKTATATDTMTFTPTAGGAAPRSTTGPTSTSAGCSTWSRRSSSSGKLEKLADETVAQLEQTLRSTDA